MRISSLVLIKLSLNTATTAGVPKNDRRRVLLGSGQRVDAHYLLVGAGLVHVVKMLAVLTKFGWFQKEPPVIGRAVGAHTLCVLRVSRALAPLVGGTARSCLLALLVELVPSLLLPRKCLFIGIARMPEPRGYCGDFDWLLDLATGAREELGHLRNVGDVFGLHLTFLKDREAAA